MDKITKILKNIWNSYKNWLGDKVWYKNWKVWLSVLVVLGVAGMGTDAEADEAESEEPEQEEVVEEKKEEKEVEKEPIDVNVEIEPIIEDGINIYVEGKTNLPDYAELLFTITNDDYTGQTKTIVEEGIFKTEPFSKDDARLPAGEYDLSITLPIPATQDKKFIQEAGEDYEYLTGDLMKEAEVGKVMDYSTTFVLESSEYEPESFDPNNYNKDLTFNDLARNPEENILEKVTFEGKIIQVIQDDKASQFRIATNDDYDKVMLIEIDNSLLNTRILEDDYIRFYGTYMGEMTYESTLGGNITVPAVLVDEFEFQ